jgi:hypothetical protein
VKKTENAIFCCRQIGPSFVYDIVIDNQPHLDNAFNFCTFPNSYNAKHDKNSTNAPCLFKPNDGIKFHINYIKVFLNIRILNLILFFILFYTFFLFV